MKYEFVKDKFLIVRLILASVIIVVISIAVRNSISTLNRTDSSNSVSLQQQDKVLPPEGLVLPIMWGDIGKKLVENGVIDLEKFQALYNSPSHKELIQNLLSQPYNKNLVITKENAGIILNILWAFGLANKNKILEEGPMTDPRYGGAGNFASTGGWTLAKGEAMDHYSKHKLVILNEVQQNLVEKVSKNIYRPCCGNSTYFPDCNHGMAMLGLLELMAANNIDEDQMYEVALKVNSYWFPSTYLTLAKYFELKGLSWDKVNPKEVLGATFSSADGYRQILAEVEPAKYQGGGSCGV